MAHGARRPPDGMTPGPVAVIGAGWAGLSAALALAETGRRVLLLEAAAVPGGRARTLKLDGIEVDNGQHILVGACHGVLGQLRAVGVDPAEALSAQPFGLRLHAAGAAESGRTGFAFSPASTRPWSLAAALFRVLQGTPAPSRLLAVAGAARMLHIRLRHDLPVQEWLARNRQPEVLIRTFWEPLCLAVMNAPAVAASALLFQNTLRRTLMGGKSDAELLIPRHPLGALFPEPALRKLHALGAEVRMRTRVAAITAKGSEDFLLQLPHGGTLHAAQVIVATGHRAAARLLPILPVLETTRRLLGALGERAICTVYLRYRQALTDLPPLSGLLEQEGHWLLPRWVAGAPHWAAVVISAAEDFTPRDAGDRWRRVGQQLATTFPGLGLPTAGRSVCERLATFDTRPGIDTLRPGPETGLPGLYLAGDYCARGLPATLEAAVQGGLQAALVVHEPPHPRSRLGAPH